MTREPRKQEVSLDILLSLPTAVPSLTAKELAMDLYLYDPLRDIKLSVALTYLRRAGWQITTTEDKQLLLSREHHQLLASWLRGRLAGFRPPRPLTPERLAYTLRRENGFTTKATKDTKATKVKNE